MTKVTANAAPWRLYEFPQSHYCEIVRWVLGLKGQAYESVLPLPAWHGVVAKRLGCAATTLPILQRGDTVVQGSAAIVDYLEQLFPEPSLTPSIPTTELAAFEGELSDRIAAPLRQLCYAHLLQDPATIRFLFMHRSGPVKRLLFRFLQPVLHHKLRDGYNATPAGQATAESQLADAFAHYNQLLAGKSYFFDNRFTRADLTFAALLAPAALPDQHPLPWPPPLRNSPLALWFNQFADSLSFQHLHRVYQQHRQPT